MKLPEILYGPPSGAHGVTHTRYGSAKLGAVLVVVRFRAMRPSYVAEVGRLGIAYGPAGGVEAGIDDLTAEELGPCRVFYRRSGMALAVNWAGRAAATR